MTGSSIADRWPHGCVRCHPLGFDAGLHLRRRHAPVAGHDLGGHAAGLEGLAWIQPHLHDEVQGLAQYGTAAAGTEPRRRCHRGSRGGHDANQRRRAVPLDPHAEVVNMERAAI